MEQTSNLISVIVPVYNVEKYLSRCLDSIINQTYKNLEIILIDDGSPDNSGKICDEYAKQDSRIKVIHKENGGVSSARNVGLENATGDYITFVDSDDWIEVDMYECMLAQNQDVNYDIIKCSHIFEYVNKKTNSDFIYKNSILIEKEQEKEEFIELVLEGKVMPSLWSMLIKRNKINELSLEFNESLIIGEDFIFTLELFFFVNSIYIYNKHLYHYFIHEESAMNSATKNLKNARNLIELYKNMENLLVKYNSHDDEFKEKTARYIFYRIYSRISSATVETKRKDIIVEFFENEVFRTIVKKVSKERLSFWGKLFLRFAKRNQKNKYYIFCYIYEFLKKIK